MNSKTTHKIWAMKSHRLLHVSATDRYFLVKKSPNLSRLSFLCILRWESTRSNKGGKRLNKIFWRCTRCSPSLNRTRGLKRVCIRNTVPMTRTETTEWYSQWDNGENHFRGRSLCHAKTCWAVRSYRWGRNLWVQIRAGSIFLWINCTLHSRKKKQA